MKESFWGYWLILLGVFVVVIMMLIQNVTSNSTEDYYTVKQISEAALIDAVDYAYYREYGEVRINKEALECLDIETEEELRIIYTEIQKLF